jgi:glycosyltransferase involved in cell wall biosynthesis
LAEKILLLLRNPELANRLREPGRMKVEKEFSLNSMMEKYQELYRNC